MASFKAPEQMFTLMLKCNHFAYTPIELREQYSSDRHFVMCPDCVRDGKDPYARLNTGTAWQEVVEVVRITPDELREMSNVHGWNVEHVRRFITDRDIIRIQPSIPSHRVRPFPYRQRTI